jgi:hypothetical protein
MSRPAQGYILKGLRPKFTVSFILYKHIDYFLLLKKRRTYEKM